MLRKTFSDSPSSSGKSGVISSVQNGARSLLRKINPSHEVAAALEMDNETTFRYTFSPGRGPFNEPLNEYSVVKHGDCDVKRVTVVDNTNLESSATNQAKQLWQEVRGIEGHRSPPGYLHTKQGALSPPHTWGACALTLGESFMTKTSHDNLEAGRVLGTLSTCDENSLRIKSSTTLENFTYDQAKIGGRLVKKNGVQELLPGLSDKYPGYAPFIEVQEDGVPRRIDIFLNTKLYLEYSMRYVVAQSDRPDIYDWRRRMDSIILGENIDDILSLNLETLAGKYSERLALSLIVDSVDEENESVSSANASSAPASLEKGRPASFAIARFSMVAKKEEAKPPRFTDENPVFEAFATLEFLKQAMLDDINDCRGQFARQPNAGDTGVLIFESSTLTLTLRMAQYANKTIQNIRADLFLRRARLKFMEACLEQPDVNMPGAQRKIFDIVENQTGFCETLLNDLEHPLFESDEKDVSIVTLLASAQALVSPVREMRNATREFDVNLLKGVVKNLMDQANKKEEALKAFCQLARENSQKEIWKTAKELIRETDLPSKLTVLSNHMQNPSFKKFAEDCSDHLSTITHTRKAFKRILEKPIDELNCPIVDAVKQLTLQMSSDYSADQHAHRRDFLAPISEEEIARAEGFDPFLMYTIRKILVPREQLIQYLEQIDNLNAYYTLLEICATWNPELKAQLEGAIAKLKQLYYENDGFKDNIKSLILNLPSNKKNILYRQLLPREASYFPPILEELQRRLYEHCSTYSAENERFTDDRLKKYIDKYYYQALSLRHAFKSFDKVICDFIEKNISPENRVHSDDYKMAIFYHQFYIGIFFRDYLRDQPQTGENWRVFLHSGLSKDNWVENHFPDLADKNAARKAVIHVNTCLSHVIQNSKTPAIYIEKLEAALSKNELDSLGESWSNFIRLCAWIAVLVNERPASEDINTLPDAKHERRQDLFSSEEIQSIYVKINAILDEENRYFSPLLLATMQRLWNQYCEWKEISQRAIEEWRQRGEVVSFEAVKRLCDLGEQIFKPSSDEPQALGEQQASALDEHQVSDKPQASAVEKTLWLTMALQFYHGIKDHLSQNRISLALTKHECADQHSSEDVNTPLSSTEERRMYVAKILGYILSNPNLSYSQRKAIQQCTQDIFKNEAIRELTLDDALEKIKQFRESGKQEAINDLLELQIPGFVFSSSECEIFAESEYVPTVQRLLKAPSRDADALTVDIFIERIKKALKDVEELLKTPRFIAFIPCLLRRLFVAFSVTYDYLMTTQQPIIKKRAIKLWEECLESIRLIANINGIGNQEHYLLFARVWETIGQRAFAYSTEDIQSKLIKLQQRLNLDHLVLAYDMYLQLREAKFNVNQAIALISEQWHYFTRYEIAENAVKPLSFILASQDGHSYKKLHLKLQKIMEFLIDSVEKILVVNNIVCLQVSDYYRLSSYTSFRILPVTINEKAQLESERVSSRQFESLDQITIDWAQVYSTRMRAENYVFVFMYQPPSLKTWINPSSEQSVVRCVEVYKDLRVGKIVRKDCFVSDTNHPNIMSESSWTSFAASELSVERDNSALYEMISFNSGISIKSRILPEFFRLVFQLIQDTLQFTKQWHAPAFTPISVAFLRPASADYYDPRALLHCREEELVGIFVLGLIYREIEQKGIEYTTALRCWLQKLPNFFEKSNNVKKLAHSGIVTSGILCCGLGVFGQYDPIENALRTLDGRLTLERQACQNEWNDQTRQARYVTFFKNISSQERRDSRVSISDISTASADEQSMHA